MPFFNNRRKDFSIQPPRQQVDGTPFFVTDSANIDFTLANLNLTANLTTTGITAGTYGSPTLIPVVTLDIYGRVTGISTTTFSASGIALEVNGTPNLSQTILNLIDSATIEVVDLGGGDIEFNYIGTGGSGTVTSVSAGTGMSFTTITTSGSVAIDTTKVPYIPAGFSTGLLKWDGTAWVFDTNTYLTTISGLNISLLTNDSGYITSAALTGYVPTTRTLTINGTTYDLSADRSWTITGSSPLTTKGDLYTFDTADARLPVGLDTQVLLADSTTATGLKWGSNTTPPASGYYFAISDSTDQTNPTANTPRAVKFNTIDLANGFSLQTETAVFTGTINNGGAGAGTILNVTGVASGTLKVGMVLTGGSITAGTFISAFTSGTGGIGTYEVSVSQNRASATYTGTMTSEIVCANTGVYNIQFSSQMDKSDAGVDYVNFWLRKNGVDIPESAGVISLQGNAPAYMMAAWNYLVQLVAGDVIELYWGSADVNMEIIHEPAQTSPFAHPAIQSTILTITQQSGILAGTGITAINSLTAAAQTLASTDLNISSAVATHNFSIANNAVTYAKMQAVSATSILLGSSSTTTPVQEITLGTNLSMSGTTLNASGGGVSTGAIVFQFDGAGGVIPIGQYGGYYVLPYNFQITSWRLLSTTRGTTTALNASIVVDTYSAAAFPNTTSIWGGSKPTLTTASSATATGLSINLTAGNLIGFNVDSSTLGQLITLTLIGTKS